MASRQSSSRATLAILFATACTSYTLLTPADLEQRGTRRFSSVTTTASAVEASANALETLGYHVTQKSPDTGIVKTAPQDVLVSQDTKTELERSAITARVEGATSTSTITRDALAWTLRISTNGSEVKILATPRAYRNGNELTENAFVAEVMEPKFNAIWREIEDSIGSQRGAAATK